MGDLTKKQKRQGKALFRLLSQLESGVKVTKDGREPLTNNDKERINREIDILKKRIV